MASGQLSTDVDDPASLDSFIGKWHERWPEWSVLGVFVPQTGRDVLGAWFALLQELRDAAWSGREVAPGLAKLAWWQEELRGWPRGARRHPLGIVLRRCQAPWHELGGALSTLPSTRAPASPDDEELALTAFATQLLACESALFGGAVPEVADVAATVATVRGERALVLGDRASASGLRDSLDLPLAASCPRRLQRVAVASRLQMLASGRKRARVRALRLLLSGWSAARGG